MGEDRAGVGSGGGQEKSRGRVEGEWPMMASIETWPPPSPPAGSRFQRRSRPPPASGGEAKQNGEVSVRWEGEGGGRAGRRTTSPFSATRKQLLLNVPPEEEQETKAAYPQKTWSSPPPVYIIWSTYTVFFPSFFPKIMEVPLLKVKRYARRPTCNSLLITFHSQEVLSRD